MRFLVNLQHLLEHGVCVLKHRPEFQAMELTSVSGQSRLPEKHGARTAEQYCNSAYSHQGKREHKQQRCNDKVKTPAAEFMGTFADWPCDRLRTRVTQHKYRTLCRSDSAVCVRVRVQDRTSSSQSVDALHQYNSPRLAAADRHSLRHVRSARIKLPTRNAPPALPGNRSSTDPPAYLESLCPSPDLLA